MTKPLFDELHKLNHTTKTLDFPGNEELASSEDCASFLAQLQKKLTQSQWHLKMLVLSPATNELLKGLIAYCDSSNVLDINTIQICINEKLDIDTLTNALSGLNNARLANLIFIDDNNHLSGNDWERISRSIKEKNIAVAITLASPQFFISSIQRDIDVATAASRVVNNAYHLSHKAEIKHSALGLLGKRSRPKSNKNRQNLLIDIDLQQDVQLETLIEQDIQQEVQKEAPDYKHIKALNFKELVEYVKRGNGLKFDARLLTESMLQTLWNTWTGVIDEHRNQHPIFPRITREAARQLLTHRHLFYAGLNKDSLPQGFSILFDDNNLVRALHYDESLLQNDEAIAPVVIERPSTLPLPHELCDKLLQRLNNQPLITSWRAMNKGPYLRLLVDPFRRHLPLLLDLSPELLEDVLAFTDNATNNVLLGYLLDNYRQIHTITKKHSPDNAGLIPEAFRVCLLDEHGIETLKSLATRLSEHNFEGRCFLGLLADSNKDLYNKALDWQRTLDFNDKQTQAMLQVYAQYGETGLEHLFALWGSVSNQAVLKHLFDTLFKTASTFVPMIQDDKIAKAINYIVGLTNNNPNQALWWSVLLKQHAEAVGYDDLPTLVDSFSLFIKQIDAFGLSFYPEQAFANVKNMPTVLHRMISLLNNCDDKDRPLQWACLTELDWQSNGATKALYDSTIGRSNPYRFITPDMQMTPEYYDDYKDGYLPGYEVDWIRDPQKEKPPTFKNGFAQGIFMAFGADNQSENALDIVRRHYYRYVAAEKHRFPLSFYQAMDKAIQDTTFTKLEKADLYALMARATTGEVNGQCSANLNDDINNGLNLLEKLGNVKLLGGILRPVTRLGLLDEEELMGSESPSLLAYQQQLLILEHALKFKGLNPVKAGKGVYDNVMRVDKANWLEREMNNCYGHLVVEKSFHFYTKDSFKNLDEPLYYKHLDVMIVLSEGEPRVQREVLGYQYYFLNRDELSEKRRTYVPTKIKPLPREVVGQLLSLISLFNLTGDSSAKNKKNAETIHTLVSKALEKGKAISIGLDFLMQIKKEHAKSLKPKQLIAFINAFTIDKAATMTEAEIVSIVQKHFKESFEPDFFDTIQLKQLLPEVRAYLDSKFPDEADKKAVEQLLITFLNPSDIPNHLALCKKIYSMGLELSSKERQMLLAQLTLPMLTANLNAKTFCEYLKPIKTNEDVSECLYIIQKAKALSMDANSEVLQRINIYLTSLWPEIKTTLLPIIPSVELHHLAVDFLLSLESLTVECNAELNTASSSSHEAPREFISNHQLFLKVFEKIHGLVSYYHNDKLLLTQYSHYFLTHNKPRSQLLFALNSMSLLADEFLALNNSDMIRSLCLHFSKPSGDYTHLQLVNVLKNPNYKALSLGNKRIVLGILTSLLDNNKQSSLDDFNRLLEHFNSASKDYIAAIGDCYQRAPFPELTTLLDWLNWPNCPEEEKIDYLKSQYSQFDKQPAAREERNGFDINLAVKQAKKIQGIRHTLQDLVTIADEVGEVKALTTKAICEELNALRGGESEMSDERLLALSAELLYRTKGGSAGSFEINTTQYLAIYSMLKSGEHVTSQIGTGEGKSRIMMIMIACQYARGKTVDFITSNMQLATRDYLAFRAFFQALGAKTRLIHQHTRVNDYALDGINFSDLGNINLFRNKAYTDGANDSVIHPDTQQRALMLDEADRAFFDLSDTRFNYSAAVDGVIRDMPWVYDLLVRFFSQDNDNIIARYHEDINACTIGFIAYAKDKLSPTQYQRLLSVSTAQLEAWQESAVQALALNLDEHFIIKAPVDIHTAKGPKQVSDACLLVGNRQDSHSRYSFGVHQCLHARLNQLNKDKSLPVVYEDDFFIDSEKQIIYSSTSQSMLNEYRQGTLMAVTGTAGSASEQNEVKDMTFLSIPRHLGLKRNDHPIYLTANENKQYQRIEQYLLKAQIAKQPCLIICESDAASKKVAAYLKANLPQNVFANLTRIDGQTSSDDEDVHIKTKAGQPGAITVATDRLGRGTDIALHGDANQEGLKVLLTYLPDSSRSMQQILGRSGRLGAKGDTHTILNKQKLKTQLGKKSLNDGFYTATEAYINHQLTVLENGASRVIQGIVYDFRETLQRRYHQVLQDALRDADIDTKVVSVLWKTFVEEADRGWRELWPHVSEELTKPTPDFKNINQQLSVYRVVVQRSWKPLTRALNKLPEKVGELKVSDDIIKTLKQQAPPMKPSLKTSVYEHYDPAHDGKATLYKRYFEQTRAFFRGERPFLANIRAWWNGRGILFPNLRAWWAGRMSFREFIFGGRSESVPEVSKDSYTAMSQMKANPAPKDKVAAKPVHTSSIYTKPVVVEAKKPASAPSLSTP